MRERILIICIFGLAVSAIFAKEACEKRKTLTVKEIIEKVAEKSKELQSFSSGIVYSLTEEPEIFKTTTTYTGRFEYLKTDDRQYAMIDFYTRKEDEMPAADYRQQYIFDGVWLTRIDYQLKQVNRDQLAPKDKPENVLKLISEDFPLMGFSGAKNLSNRYNIELEQAKDKKIITLNLTAKKDAETKYTRVRFDIDKSEFLPARIIAVSSEDNSICDIKLPESRANIDIKAEIFKPEIPDDFTVSTKKLEHTEETNRIEDNEG